MSRITNRSTVLIAALMFGAAGSAFAYDTTSAGQASGPVLGTMAQTSGAQHCDSPDLVQHSTSAQDTIAERPAMSSHRWRTTPSDPFKDHGT